MSICSCTLYDILDKYSNNQFSLVQSLSCVWLFVTPWTAELQASLSITNSTSLLKLMSIESVVPSNHLKDLKDFFSQRSFLSFLFDFSFNF